MEAFKDIFICVDQADLVVMGKLDSVQASLIQVDFVKCDSSERDDCKSEEKIYEFLGS